jgi:RNA polymerase sigma factor (TIGR02999 family)
MNAVPEMPVSGRTTELLLQAGRGSESARDELLPLVYDELRRIAARYLRRERRDHTLQPTALVHEAYLRLIDQRQVDWRNRAQFVGLAAMMMRRVLVNHARDRVAARRGGDADRIPLTIAIDEFDEPQVNLLALHQALDRLQAVDARKSRVVELKFFGGLTTTEIGEVLQLSHATIEREWSFARAWLYKAIGANAPPSPS